ncbi:MAG: hypothetical protein FH756_06155 [Firmicutes bacterium]|nr:hypothetical protein [Bacillota bacterium]
MARVYYFFDVEVFDVPEPYGLRTEQQLTFPGMGKDADPITELKLIKKNFYINLHQYSCIHEVVDKKPRRFGGEPAYYPNSITGADKPCNVFYDWESRQLIFQGARRVAFGAMRRLIKQYPKQINVSSGEIDFSFLIENTKSVIVGTWFSGLNGQVKSIGMFGDRVNLDERFELYQRLGAMTALYLEITPMGNPKPCKIMISKDRGVVIHEDWTIEQDLEFLLKIKPLLFGKTK